MIGQPSFNGLEKKLLGFGLLALVFAYFYNLGIYPLFQEEPRRGIIALEMMMQDNFWVPTQTGDLYYRKPPVYNWLLIVGYKIFGTNELGTRFFSVLSHLILGGLCYVFVKKPLGSFVAAMTALSFLLVGDILVSASTLGEIDLFYSLVTTSSIFLIYRYGEKKEYLKLFLVVYALTAIGFLTKGLSALPFTAISLLVYFILNRNFKQLLRWQHFAGIGLFVLMAGGYFYAYSLYEDPTGWMNTLFSESADKATGGGFWAFAKHVLEFPIKTWQNILPAGLFIVLLFQKGMMKKLRANPFVWYCTLIFFFNYLVYLFSIEGKSRYIYPIMPFVLVTLVYMATLNQKQVWNKFMKVLAWVCLALLTLGTPVVFFLEDLQVVDNLAINIALILLSVAGLWVGLVKKQVRPVLIIYFMMILLKFGFSAIVPVTRQKATGAAEDKALAAEMVQITGDQPIYRYKDLRMSLTIVFYVERDKHAILASKDRVEPGYYICYEEDFKDFPGAEILHEFTYFGSIPMYFIKYRNPEQWDVSAEE